MRISIIGHAASPFGHKYGKAFMERGHQAQLLSMSAYEGDSPDVPVKVVGPTGFRPISDKSRLTPYLKTIGPVRREVRRFQPDIVFGMNLASGGVLGCLSRGPHVVVSARGSDVASRVGSLFWQSVYRWELRRADLVHVVSDPLAEALRNWIHVEPDRIVLAPLGVDTEFLSLVDFASRPDDGQILCTRSHKKVYDQATLIRAMARLRNQGVAFHVTFADPLQADTTRRLIHDYGLAGMATFLDGYTVEQLPALMANADVYVSTSLSDGTSNSLLEAMSTGTFPVVTDIAANRPWVQHGRNGFLFPPGDDEALSDRLLEAMTSSNIRADAAPLSRQVIVEKGDLYRNTDRLLAAFDKCLASDN